VTEPSQQQINKTLNKIGKEHHAILFIYMANWEQMDNDSKQCKDPFPKTIADASRVLAEWMNRYSARDNKMTDANDSVAFATTSEEVKRIRRRKLHATNVKKWALCT